MKNKYVAAALAFFLGTFGIHKFYLREPGAGIFYIVMFMMTNRFFPVSALLGMIDGVRYLTMSETDFNQKFNSGTRGKITRRSRKRKEREYYEFPSNKKSPRQSRRERRLRSNPFKKSGLKKYKDYDIEEAIIDFEKGLKIQPQDVSLHFNLACSYSLLENKESAFEHIAKAVAYGYTDYNRIQTHDDLAYMRIQPEYEPFKNGGYKHMSKKQVSKSEDDELLLEKLGKLVEMRKRGIVTEADFRIEREKILRKA